MERKAGNVRRREEFDGPPGLARFFRGPRLDVVPPRAADRAAVLTYISERFEPGRAYDEREVNSLLLSAADDVVSLRRFLIDAGLLVRAAGVYRRP